MTLNKYLWLRLEDARDMYEERNLPADRKYRLLGKYENQVVLEVVSVGHRLESKVKTLITGLVVRDHRGSMWQARYESDGIDSAFVGEIRGFVQFTRCTMREETRTVFEEVD